MREPKTRVQPRTLKGFRDLLPMMALIRNRTLDTVRAVFERHGYVPIETPALEYLEILQAKAGEESDKLTYSFEDSGKRRVGLRFDLTIPFARYVAQHQHEISMPFKRYQFGLVWRGENPQRGRYREFLQCDFDIIGSASPIADFETILTLFEALYALNLPKFTLFLNDRRILVAVLDELGIAHKSVQVLRTIDKFNKIGPQMVVEKLETSVGLGRSLANEIVNILQVSGSNEQRLGSMSAYLARSSAGMSAVRNLMFLLEGLSSVGVSEEYTKIDYTLARGMDYYTGVITEAFVDSSQALGAVASGGRYDDLTSHFSSARLPGVGASLGIDRLAALLSDLSAQDYHSDQNLLMIATFDGVDPKLYVMLAHELRKAGLAVETYLGADSLTRQLRYADRGGFSVVLLSGPDEVRKGVIVLKHLKRGDSVEVAREPYELLVRSVARFIEAPSTTTTPGVAS